MTADTATRADAIETVARDLLPSASRVTRLLLRRGSIGINRAEAGVLSTLYDGPLRITELAARECLAQPTMTQLVAKLADRSLVARGRDPHDGRAVLVSLTPAGRQALDDIRAEYRGVLREQLAERSDDELHALATATEVLDDLIAVLQGRREA